MSRTLARLKRATPGLVRGLCVVFGLAPIVVWLTADVAALAPLRAPFEWWFDFQCHREPGRSEAWLGRFLPVCDRCLGIYLGLALGALAMRPRLDPWPMRIWVGFAALVMVLDVATEQVGLRGAFAPLRFATGLLLSWPVAVSLVLAARELVPPPRGRFR